MGWWSDGAVARDRECKGFPVSLSKAAVSDEAIAAMICGSRTFRIDKASLPKILRERELNTREAAFLASPFAYFDGRTHKTHIAADGTIGRALQRARAGMFQ